MPVSDLWVSYRSHEALHVNWLRRIEEHTICRFLNGVWWEVTSTSLSTSSSSAPNTSSSSSFTELSFPPRFASIVTFLCRFRSSPSGSNFGDTALFLAGALSSVTGSLITSAIFPPPNCSQKLRDFNRQCSELRPWKFLSLSHTAASAPHVAITVFFFFFCFRKRNLWTCKK